MKYLLDDVYVVQMQQLGGSTAPLGLVRQSRRFAHTHRQVARVGFRLYNRKCITWQECF